MGEINRKKKLNTQDRRKKGFKKKRDYIGYI
jgi:hypothetical protein